MSNHKTRITNLEKTERRRTHKPTWREFITGEWKPSAAAWLAFLDETSKAEEAAKHEQIAQQT